MITVPLRLRFEPLAGEPPCAIAIETDVPGRLVACVHWAEWQMYRWDGKVWRRSVPCCGMCKAKLEDGD